MRKIINFALLAALGASFAAAQQQSGLLYQYRWDPVQKKWIQVNGQAPPPPPGGPIITPQAGDVWMFNGTAWGPGQVSVQFSIGGDLSGTLAQAVVAGIRGVPVSPDAPLSGQFLRFNGTRWEPYSLSWPQYSWTEILDKPLLFPPQPHTHTAAEIVSGLLSPERLGIGTPDASKFLRGDGRWEAPVISWSSVTGKPNLFPPAAHSHNAAEINAGVFVPERLGAGQAGSTTFLRGDGQWAPVSLSWAEITGKPATFPPTAHNHDASQIVSGILAPARLGSGTPSSSVFLRGDGQWADATVKWENVLNPPATYPPSSHVHSAADITTGLLNPARLGNGTPMDWTFLSGDNVWRPISWSIVQGKPTMFLPEPHQHTAADIASGLFAPGRLGTGTPSTSTFLRGDQQWAAISVDWQNVLNKPAEFAPSSHTHSADQITAGVFSPARLGLGIPQSNNFLRGDGQWASVTVSWNDVQSKPAVFPPQAHSHAAGDITSGTLNPARMGTGTPDNTKFLRGDGQWMPVSVLWANIPDKPALFPPQSHGHDAADLISGTVAPARLGSGTPSNATFLRGDGQWSAVTVDWTNIVNKPAAFPPSAHNHSAADITSGVFNPARLGSGTPDATKVLRGDGQWTNPFISWTDISGKPSSFPPSAHSHAASEITSGVLSTARLGTGTADATKVLRGDGAWSDPFVSWSNISGKPSVFPPSSHPHDASDIQTGVIAPQRLGAGTPGNTVFLRGDGQWAGIAWSLISGIPNQFPPEAHTHAAADITAGIFNPSRLGSGTPSSGTVLRGDGQWVAPFVDWTNISSKPAVFPPAAHAHSAADIQSGVLAVERLGTGTAGNTVFLRGDGQWQPVDWNLITGKPSSFAPAPHMHDLTDLQSGGAATGQVLTWNGTAWAPQFAASPVWGAITGNLTDQADLNAALAGKANISHAHSAGDVTSGVFAASRLGTGTADATKILRGDSTWADPFVDWTNVANKPAVFPSAPHVHDASEVQSGILATGRLGAGTADGTVFLRGDGQWAAVSWNLVSGKPSVFPAAPHTHSLADLTQSGATAGQVATWDGTAWTPASIPATQWGQITGTLSSQTDLTAALAAKANVSHTHTASDITNGSPDATVFLRGDSTWARISFADLDDVPNSFNPSPHTHSVSELTQSGATTGQYLAWNGTSWAPSSLPAVRWGQITGTLSNQSDLAAALAEKANTSHTHQASDIVAGVISTARLGSGTADTTVFLRGDSTWAKPSFTDLQNVPSVFPPAPHSHSLSDITVPSGGTNGAVLYASGTSIARGSSLVYDAANNRIGIGTAGPQALLDVNGQSAFRDRMAVGGTHSPTNLLDIRTSFGNSGISIMNLTNNGGPSIIMEYYANGTVPAAGSNLTFRSARGSHNGAQAVTTFDTIASQRWLGYNGSFYITAAEMRVRASDTFTTSVSPGEIVFRTGRPGGGMSDTFRIGESGEIEIFQTNTVTPAAPQNSNGARIYIRNNQLIIQYNDAGTVRYKYLPLNGTSVTWVHTTTAP